MGRKRGQFGGSLGLVIPKKMCNHEMKRTKFSIATYQMSFTHRYTLRSKASPTSNSLKITMALFPLKTFPDNFGPHRYPTLGHMPCAMPFGVGTLGCVGALNIGDVLGGPILATGVLQNILALSGLQIQLKVCLCVCVCVCARVCVCMCV